MALALQDQVRPSLPISLASASTRGRLSVSVSSSKKNSFTCGKAAFAQRNSSMTWPTLLHAIAMAADGLRPEAEGAARFAAAPRVEGDVGVLQIAAEIILDDEVALIDRRDEGKRVHVLEDRPIGIVDDDAIVVAIGEAGDLAEVASFGDLLDRVIELVPRHEVDRA